MRRIEVAERAQQDVERLGLWWRMHREKAPDLFEEELTAAYSTIQEHPEYGQRYRVVRGKQVWRWLMPKTKRHVYYRLDGDDVVRIMAVWGAIRGREPKL